MEPAKYIAQRFLTRYEAEFTDYLSGKKDKESIKEGLEHLADAVLFDKLLPYPLVYKASLERERPVNPSPSLQKQIKPEIVAKFVSKKAEQLLTIFNKYEKVINIINKYSPVLIEELSHRLTETMLNSFKRMNEPTLVSFLTKFAEQRKHKMTVSMPIEKDEKTKSTTFKKCN